MDSLKINKFININMLHPKSLSDKHYYFTIDWGTANNVNDGTIYRTLVVSIYHVNNDLIAKFSFARYKRNNYFTLFSYGLDYKYYDNHQSRYFDLYLPLDSKFVQKLKKEYYNNIIKIK